MLGGPLGLILAGAAVVSLTMPAVKRAARPVMRGTIRGAYMVADSLRHASEGMKDQWDSVVSETRVERNQAQTDGMISNAWRNPDYSEPADDPETGRPY